jgi:hypothetical protein
MPSMKEVPINMYDISYAHLVGAPKKYRDTTSNTIAATNKLRAHAPATAKNRL